MDKNYPIINAAVQEYLQVSKVRDWTDEKRIAARAAVRAVMLRLGVYQEFCVRSGRDVQREADQ